MAVPADKASPARNSHFGSVVAVAATLLLTLLLAHKRYSEPNGAEVFDAVAPAAVGLVQAGVRGGGGAADSFSALGQLTAKLDTLISQTQNSGAAAKGDQLSQLASTIETHVKQLESLAAAVEQAKAAAEKAAAAAASGNSAGEGAARAVAAIGSSSSSNSAAVKPRLAYDTIRGAYEPGAILTPEGALTGSGRACIVGTYHGDFEVVTSLLKQPDGPGFVFVRYADGELGVAQGRDIGNEEWHFSPGQGSVMQQDLLASLKGHYGQRYWYAFASPLDDGEGLKWYLQRTEQACGYVSYANMWVNSHYPQTQALLRELSESLYKGRTVLVVNEESVNKVRAAGWLGGGEGAWAVDALALKDNLVTSWDGERAKIKAEAEALAKRYSGHLFMVSGGPVGKVIISWMWAANPSNKYVDFGSTLDPFLRGKHTRAYHNPNHAHAAQVDPSWYIHADGNPVSM